MEAKYTLQYFIDKFEAIPEDQWTDSGKYVDDNGCKCAYGHCGVVNSINESEESEALFELEWDFPYSIPKVNDNKSGDFDILGSTPKQRVLNYLKSFNAPQT